MQKEFTAQPVVDTPTVPFPGGNGTSRTSQRDTSMNLLSKALLPVQEDPEGDQAIPHHRRPRHHRHGR